MMAAAIMGATSFVKGLGAMHALSHAIGALVNTQHGLTNAVLMPYVIKANRMAIEPVIQRAAAYIGLADHSFDSFLDWILGLRTGIGIPHSLADIGIDEKRLVIVAQMAVEDPSAGGNPIAFSVAQYEQLLQRAIIGVLAD